ncbi:MAG: FtsX-like permease family protein [Oscillospiraceae bacterium]|nr:FtsX-like permease family protein [Oscillospiraceae bacterium]
MFRFSLRKMLKNRWLTISLLIGYLMAVAIVASMPIYSHAILNRMLQKDLEQVQTQSSIYPGRITADISMSAGASAQKVKTQSLRQYDQMLHDQILPEIGLPVQEDILQTAAEGLRIARGGTAIDDVKKNSRSADIACRSDLFEHVTLLDGAFPSGEEKDGVVEAIVSEAAAKNLNCALGSTYDVYRYSLFGSNAGSMIKVVSIRITGIYTAADPGDLFWVMPMSSLSTAAVIDPDLFNTLFVDTEEPLFNKATWACEVDYTAMTPENCAGIAESVLTYADTKIFPPHLRTSFGTILESYAQRRADLNATLWIIEVPILLMLLLYVFMVSRLILNHEKNEIAVLQSRGSSKRQVTGVCLFQAVFLSAAALITGPFLSRVFCRIIGASNGFMEFVSRKALAVEMTLPAVQYACTTAAVLVLTMLIAVLSDRDSSIVSFKRKKSGRATWPLWQKLCLDVICLAVSLYGLYNFRNRLQVIRETGASASDVPIDFLLYGSSTLFILGATLFFLRIFPLLIKLIYRIGQRLWGPVLYLTLLNISRSARQNQMISLFLIFTLSMGVFNAVTVRTLNRNDEDRIRYSVGADIVLQEEWPNTGGNSGPSDPNGTGGTESTETVYYTEPRFSKYEEMETAESAARVLTVEKTSLSASSKRINNVTLMGIVPDEFGRTCWFRNGLLPYHLNEYLNLLASDPRALLLSNKAMEEYDLSPGDTVYITIPGNKDSMQCVVYAGIDYFPSFNPVSEGKNKPILAVANLVYLQQETKLQPYEIWLKKASGVTSAELYAELEEIGVMISSLEDTSVQITNLKNDPMTQGINGFFTLSFLVTMLITFIGFFIYWILAIKGRLLQFGILRSMGLSRLSVILVLLWEQILVSVTAILTGLGLGTLTATLFAPILECNVDASEQMLPFMVVAYPSDYWRIAAIVAVMMTVAALVLGRIVYRLRAGEALKLGED